MCSHQTGELEDAFGCLEIKDQTEPKFKGQEKLLVPNSLLETHSSLGSAMKFTEGWDSLL